jgi:streptogramin lyase
MSSGSVPEIGSPATNTQQNDQAMAQRFEQQFCGTNTSPNSNAYVTEVPLPTECEMPVGIAIDGAKVWYVSTKHGLLGSYDGATGAFAEYEIPSWPTRLVPFTSIAAVEMYGLPIKTIRYGALTS